MPFFLLTLDPTTPDTSCPSSESSSSPKLVSEMSTSVSELSINGETVLDGDLQTEKDPPNRSWPHVFGESPFRRRKPNVP